MLLAWAMTIPTNKRRQSPCEVLPHYMRIITSESSLLSRRARSYHHHFSLLHYCSSISILFPISFPTVAMDRRSFDSKGSAILVPQPPVAHLATSCCYAAAFKPHYLLRTHQARKATLWIGHLVKASIYRSIVELVNCGGLPLSFSSCRWQKWMVGLPSDNLPFVW